MSLATNPPVALSGYPDPVSRLAWTQLGFAGGFSGASLWRGDRNGTPLFALKAWPAGFAVENLETIHRLMIDARIRFGLKFVPAVVPTNSGATTVVEGGRVWDVTAWMPGVADCRTAPSSAKLTAACTALAALHRAWWPAKLELAPCPGVRRRLALLDTFPSLAGQASAILLPDLKLSDLIRRAMSVLPRAVDCANSLLVEWVSRPVPIHPCLCDPWNDHILFLGDQVSGVIDYGSVKWDHAAVDLARMLGDLVEDDENRFVEGLTAYREAGGPVAIDAEFTRLLDRTGLVCAVLHWLLRLTTGEVPAEPEPIAIRLERLIIRLEGQTGELSRQPIIPVRRTGGFGSSRPPLPSDFPEL